MLRRAGNGRRTLPVTLILSAAVVTSSSGIAARRLARHRPPELLVVGWDGATWSVIEPLLAKGDLPALGSLVRRGASGPLHATYPLLSPRLWSTIATGMTPARHGVLGFESEWADLRAKSFWEILREEGWSVGTFSWLVTWPPEPSFAFCIPGWLARGPETVPPGMSFLKELEQTAITGRAVSLPVLLRTAGGAAREGASLATLTKTAFALGEMQMQGGLRRARGSRKDRRSAYLVHRGLELALDSDLFLSLLWRTSPRAAGVTVYGTDFLGHKYWKYHEPDSFGVKPAEVAAYGSALSDYYRAADRELARWLARTGPETTILLLSDHGMRARAYEAAWKVKGDLLLDVLGLAPWYSHAYAAAGVSMLYLTPREPAPPDSVAERLHRSVASATVVGQEQPLFRIQDQGGGQWGVWIPLGAEVSLGERVRLGGREVPLVDLLFSSERSGAHSPEGVFVVAGPDVLPGASPDSAQQEDVAPTLLYLAGLPTSAEMEGRVLTEVIRPHRLAEDAVRTVASYGAPERAKSVDRTRGREELTDRLRALGYVN